MTKKKLIIIIIVVSTLVLAVYIPAMLILFGSKDKGSFAFDDASVIEGSKLSGSVKSEMAEPAEKSAEGLIEQYTCDKNNMCGVEEIYVYENRVDLIIDKAILDSNAEKYGGSFRNTVKGIYSVKAELSVLNAYPSLTGVPTVSSNNLQYIVSVPYSYKKEDIRDPEKVVRAVEVSLNDTFYIDFYDSRLVITTQNEKSGKYEILNQWYDEKECIWGEIKTDISDDKYDFL